MKQMGSLQQYLKKIGKKTKRAIGPFSFKNPKFVMVTFIVLMVLWFSFGTFFSYQDEKEEIPKSVLTRVQVKNSTAQQKITYYTLQGHIEALNKVTLRAEAAGIVKSISAEKGDRLLAGQDIINLSFESRLARLREAQALVAQRRLEYNNSKKLELSKFRTKISLADSKSKLEAAKSALEVIQTEIEDTKVRAPFDGIVDVRHVQIGDYAKIGDSLVDFVTLDPLLGVVFISERDIRKIKLGSQAIIAGEGCNLKGPITFISSIADPNTRTYRVEVTINNPDEKTPDGLTAAFKIPVDDSMAHVLSPAAVAMNDEGVPGLKTVDEDNRVRFHPISILNHDETGVWITGIEDQARVITVGQYYVKEGEVVTPVFAQPVLTKAVQE